MFASFYGGVYQSFELPGTKIYFNQEVHHGLVLLCDGKEQPRPARLELSQDTLTIQVPIGFYGSDLQEENRIVDKGMRTVIIKRQTDGGLGFSIKGGTDRSCKVPILISNIFMDQAADATGKLFVGDAIVQVNGINTEGQTHEEVVKLLQSAGSEVELTVRYYRNMATLLRKGSLKRIRDGKSMERVKEFGSLRSNRSIASGVTASDSLPGDDRDGAPKGWRNSIKLQLPMAYITRYLWGTDKLRPNGFEVRAVDDTRSGIILCEEPRILQDWIGFISNNILSLNKKSIKVSNKYLHPNEMIVYIGWVAERLEVANSSSEAWQHWQPRFFVIKGSDIFFFESAPLSSTDLSDFSQSYKICETSCKVLKPTERMDAREHVLVIETTSHRKHYLSLESREQLLQLEGAWNRAVYYTVTRLGSRTFACNYDGRPSALTLDFNQGFSLYDIHNKVFIWRHKFSQLKSSSDDGRMRIQFVFDTSALPGAGRSSERQQASIGGGRSSSAAAMSQRTNSATEATKNIDCVELYELVFCMYNFIIAKLVSVDPDFLKSK